MESRFPLRAVRVVPSTAFLAVTIDFPASHWQLTVGQISTFSGCHSASHCLHIRRSVNNTKLSPDFLCAQKQLPAEYKTLRTVQLAMSRGEPRADCDTIFDWPKEKKIATMGLLSPDDMKGAEALFQTESHRTRSPPVDNF